jgi:hypothetical protein
MPVELNSLDDIAPERIETMFNTLTQLMQERHPEIELTRGVFHDLVLYFVSALNALMQENVDRVLQSNSLQKISQNPALADDEIVDQVLSNYNLTRDAGKAATGLATVILAFNTSTVMSTSTTLRPASSAILFRPTAPFRILPVGSTAVNDDEVVMTAVGDGTYAATITVQATTIGTAGNINRGTELQPDFTPNNITAIYTAVDFVDGRDPATNVEYISRLASGIAAKTIGGRQNYAALIRNEPEFQSIPHISILGYGDVEQKRDQHGLFPISGGGKVDIYVQTHNYAQVRQNFVEATYVGPGTLGGIWRINLDREVVPAFYEITRIVKAADAAGNNVTGYQVVTEVRGLNFDSLDFIPSIKYLYEGAYTRYQTATIQFEDTDTSIVNLVPNTSKALYAISTTSMPLVGPIQDFVAARDRRAKTADLLVRAAIPCFTKIAFQIRQDYSDTQPDLAAIRKAVSDKIATVGFSGQLHASHIAATVQQLLSGRQALGPIDMFGRIRKPDGQNIYLRDNTLLEVPHNPAELITGRTVVFLTRPEDVSVSTIVAGFAG